MKIVCAKDLANGKYHCGYLVKQNKKFALFNEGKVINIDSNTIVPFNPEYETAPMIELVFNEIIDIVCEVNAVTRQELFNSKREDYLVTARHIAVRLLMSEGYNQGYVCKVLGYHHSSGSYIVAKTNHAFTSNDIYSVYLQELYKECQRKLNNIKYW